MKLKGVYFAQLFASKQNKTCKLLIVSVKHMSDCPLNAFSPKKEFTFMNASMIVLLDGVLGEWVAAD